MACRENALEDLASAYADMQAMQAALLDSALYVRFLRAKVLELQLSDSRGGAHGAHIGFKCVSEVSTRVLSGRGQCWPCLQSTCCRNACASSATLQHVEGSNWQCTCNDNSSLAGHSAGLEKEPMAFSFEKTKQAIKDAVREASGLEHHECQKRVKQLRLRWHPGVHQVAQHLQHKVLQASRLLVEACMSLRVSTPAN